MFQLYESYTYNFPKISHVLIGHILANFANFDGNTYSIRRMMAISVGNGCLVEHRMQILKPKNITSFVLKPGSLRFAVSVFFNYHTSSNHINIVNFLIFLDQHFKILDYLFIYIFAWQKLINLVLSEKTSKD